MRATSCTAWGMTRSPSSLTSSRPTEGTLTLTLTHCLLWRPPTHTQGRKCVCVVCVSWGGGEGRLHCTSALMFTDSIDESFLGGSIRLIAGSHPGRGRRGLCSWRWRHVSAKLLHYRHHRTLVAVSVFVTFAVSICPASICPRSRPQGQEKWDERSPYPGAC